MEHFHCSFIFANPEKEIIFLKSINLGSITRTLNRSGKVWILKNIIKTKELALGCDRKSHICFNFIHFLDFVPLCFTFALRNNLWPDHFLYLWAVIFQIMHNLGMFLINFKLSIFDNGYEIWRFALSIQHLISFKFLFIKLFHQFTNLVECPILKLRKRFEEVTLLWEVFKHDSFHELVVCLGSHGCKVTICHTSDRRSSWIVVDDGQLSKSLSFFKSFVLNQELITFIFL